MTDRPIIFSAPMVRALLAGRKTQTRRVLRVQPPNRPGWKVADQDEDSVMWMSDDGTYCACRLPYAPGDRLWVREAFCPRFGYPAPVSMPHYRADNDRPEWRRLWKPSIHMPRWASRLILTVTDVRVQRVQEISEADAMAEGVDAMTMEDLHRQAAMSRRGDFAALWTSLHGPHSWGANPWVVALTFTVQHGNIDAVAPYDPD